MSTCFRALESVYGGFKVGGGQGLKDAPEDHGEGPVEISLKFLSEVLEVLKEWLPISQKYQECV